VSTFFSFLGSCAVDQLWALPLLQGVQLGPRPLLSLWIPLCHLSVHCHFFKGPPSKYSHPFYTSIFGSLFFGGFLLWIPRCCLSILCPFFKGPPSYSALRSTPSFRITPTVHSVLHLSRFGDYSWAVSSYGFRDAFEHTLPLLQGASLQLFASILHLSSLEHYSWAVSSYGFRDASAY